MVGNIDELRDSARADLTTLGTSFDRLNALMQERSPMTEGELRKAVAALEQATKENRGKIAVALSNLGGWLEEEQLARDKLTEWKAKRQTSRLHARADLCARCAIAAIEIASLAAQEAECAVLRALFAREEAIAAQVQQGRR